MESRDKRAGLGEDKTGHNGMNIPSEDIIHAGNQNKESRPTVVASTHGMGFTCSMIIYKIISLNPTVHVGKL